MNVNVPGGSSSATTDSYIFGSKIGSLSLISCTVTTTLALADCGGTP